MGAKAVEIDMHKRRQQECGRGPPQLAGYTISVPSAATPMQPPHQQDKLPGPLSHASIMKFFLWAAAVFGFFVSSKITICCIDLCLHGLLLLYGQRTALYVGFNLFSLCSQAEHCIQIITLLAMMTVCIFLNSLSYMTLT
jgi:hypothetical protein